MSSKIFDTSQLGQNIKKVWARFQNFAYAWRCPDKILVIESDDWGSIRTSTPEAYKVLVSRGYDMSRSCWSVDALETDDDLEALFDVLDSFKDCRGRPAGITANMVMANPDFPAIHASKFQRYVYEPVSATLTKSPGRNNVAGLWQKGMKNKLFIPQFHAREHVRWWAWIEALQKGSPEALQTFDLKMCGVPLAVSKEQQSFFQPIYLSPRLLKNAQADLTVMISEGIQLFEDQFGFRSLSTVAPNVTWNNDSERIWSASGIRYIQGGYLQYSETDVGQKSKVHYLGEMTNNNGIYLVRNCNFEPTQTVGKDDWKRCFRQITHAFHMKTPAIINSHRVNYIGSIEKSNRDRGLTQLKRLLEVVCARWPEIHFLSSAELGYMIEHDLKRVRDLEDKEDEVFPVVLHAEVKNPCYGSEYSNA